MRDLFLLLVERANKCLGGRRHATSRRWRAVGRAQFDGGGHSRSLHLSGSAPHPPSPSPRSPRGGGNVSVRGSKGLRPFEIPAGLGGAAPNVKETPPPSLRKGRRGLGGGWVEYPLGVEYP